MGAFQSKNSNKSTINTKSNTKSDSEKKHPNEQRINFSYKTADEWQAKTEKAWSKLPASWRIDLIRKYSTKKKIRSIKRWILVQPRDKQEKLIKDLQYALGELEENLFEERAIYFAKIEKAYGIKL